MGDFADSLRNFMTTWSRRALTVPLYAVLCSLFIFALPLLLIITLLADALRGGAWVLTRSVLFFAIYFCCEVAGIAASFFIWLASGAWAWGRRERFLRWNFALQGWWTRMLSRSACRLFGIRIEVEGTDDLSRGPVIIFMRHASVADTLLPAMFFSNPHGLRLRYVLKRQLLWDPCLDIVGNRLPNCFVKRVSGDSLLVQRLMESLGPKDGVIIYPEGTRFSPDKRERVLARLAQSLDADMLDRAASFKSVLPPRLGGSLALLERNERADVIFCAHTGFEGTVDLRDFLKGSLVNRIVRVNFRRIPFDLIPESRAERAYWLYDNWARIDEWVGSRLRK